jgi:hypothetical protein
MAEERRCWRSVRRMDSCEGTKRERVGSESEASLSQSFNKRRTKKLQREDGKSRKRERGAESTPLLSIEDSPTKANLQLLLRLCVRESEERRKIRAGEETRNDRRRRGLRRGGAEERRDHRMGLSPLLLGKGVHVHRYVDARTPNPQRALTQVLQICRRREGDEGR